MASPALPLAFDPIGIGETGTGAVLGALGLVVLVFGSFMLFDWWDSRTARRFVEEEYQRPVTRGVLICDWVDQTVLTTIAKQRGVAPEPIRLERGEGGTIAAGLEAKGKWLGGRLSRERRQDVREYFDLPQDPNALLVKVLGKLRQDEALRLDLEEVWEGGVPFSDDFIDDVIRTAKNAPEIEAGRAALRSLRSNVMRETIASGWSHAAESPRFALVESAWKVLEFGQSTHDTDPGVRLRLAKLRRGDHPPGPHYGNPPEVPTLIDLPDGLSLTADLDRGRLTEQGKGRLVAGIEVKAALLATTGAYDESTGEFRVTPIAVFARIESYI